MNLVGKNTRSRFAPAPHPLAAKPMKKGKRRGKIRRRRQPLADGSLN
jgi:hypothetical protein